MKGNNSVPLQVQVSKVAQNGQGMPAKVCFLDAEHRASEYKYSCKSDRELWLLEGSSAKSDLHSAGKVTLSMRLLMLSSKSKYKVIKYILLGVSIFLEKLERIYVAVHTRFTVHKFKRRKH